MKPSISIALRIAATLGVVCAIGAAILALSPNGQVEEANADITDLVPASAWKGHEYSEVMSSMGLEARPYDLNGNTMYYAIGRTEQSPQDVLRNLQSAFVEAKINEKQYLEAPDNLYTQSVADAFENPERIDPAKREYLDAMISGEVVPLRSGRDHVVMGSMVPQSGADSLTGLLAAMGRQGRQEAGVFSGFRFLEARRHPKSGLTTVESTWADEDFDWRKMENPDKFVKPQAGQLEKCPGCTVEVSMNSLTPDEDYSAWQFSSRANPHRMAIFYEQNLGMQGWEKSEPGELLEYFPHEGQLPMQPNTRMLQFVKNNRWKTFLMLPSEDGRSTDITVVEAD